jgi:hypothetical protein
MEDETFNELVSSAREALRHAQSEQRFTDEQRERGVFQSLLDAHDRAMWNWRALAERGCSTEEYNEADDARDATRKAIEDYVSLLEGERDEMEADVQQLAEATNGTMRELLALRSQLDEARQTIKRLAMHTRAAHSTFGRGDDFKTSQHIGSALKELRRFDAALDGHHGEPR